MSLVQSRLKSFTLMSFLMLNIFSAVPALGAILTKQEFNGDFPLVDATSSFLEENLPENSEYSGFIIYEEDGTLTDWEINVNELDLNLTPESTSNATVNFELSSPSNWNLFVDFGLAFDAPAYNFKRTAESEITLEGNAGMAGTYVYTDTNANISESSSNQTVYEPSTVIALCLLGGALFPLKRVLNNR